MRTMYVPVVKCSKSDIAAINQLFPNDMNRVKPLVEVPLRPAGCSVADHLRRCIKNLSQCESFAFFFDPYGFLPDDVVEGGRADLAALSEAARLGATLVFGIDESFAEAATAKALAASGNGVAFRVHLDDVYDPDTTWETILFRAAELRVPGEIIDVIIDARDISELDLDNAREAIVDFLIAKPKGFARLVAVVGSSALSTVASVPVDGELAVWRREYALWAMLQFELSDTLSIAFGDYGIVHPDVVIAGPNKYANGKIRYTSGPHIHYFRGHGLYGTDTDGFAQYHQIARRVANSSMYEGMGFSAGDKAIGASANGAGRTGNLATWVTNDLNHHVTYVARQVKVVQPRLIIASSMSEAVKLAQAM